MPSAAAQLRQAWETLSPKPAGKFLFSKLFGRLVPNVLLKACTLATETFVQKRPSWVLKALPHMNTIKKVTLAS